MGTEFLNRAPGESDMRHLRERIAKLYPSMKQQHGQTGAAAGHAGSTDGQPEFKPVPVPPVLMVGVNLDVRV